MHHVSWGGSDACRTAGFCTETLHAHGFGSVIILRSRGETPPKRRGGGGIPTRRTLVCELAACEMAAYRLDETVIRRALVADKLYNLANLACV